MEVSLCLIWITATSATTTTDSRGGKIHTNLVLSTVSLSATTLNLALLTFVLTAIIIILCSKFSVQITLCIVSLSRAILTRDIDIVFLTVNTRSSADVDNRLDAFSGQSRSTNMVPFHTLHIASYCAIVTLSFTIFVFKKFHDLEMEVKGHSRSLRVLSFNRLCMVSY